MSANLYHLPGLTHHHDEFPFINSTGQRLQIHRHCYTPLTTKKTQVLILVHGYLENCRYMQPIIYEYTKRGFEVQCYELPGHGMSQGNRYDIDHFCSYEKFHQLIIEHLDITKENHFFAHSTGAIGITKQLLNNQSQPFKTIILAAPLTRIYMWSVIKTAYYFAKRWPNQIHRLRPKRGAIYQQIRNTDPYYQNTLPFNWIKQLVIYDRKQSELSTQNNAKIKVILGTDDKVIDWRHTQKFYRKHFPKADIKVLKKGTHHMYYQEGPINQSFFNFLFI